MIQHDPKALRAAFSSYITGVTIVTAMAPDGTPVGFTANSFTSVSMAPPLLLVCPGKHLSSFNVFTHTDHFAVNILADDQEAIANTFACSKEDKFASVDWSTSAHGSPLIAGSAAQFSCSTYQRIEAGDHLVLIGQVEAFSHNGRNGLGYANKGYFSLNQPCERLNNPPSRTSNATGQTEMERV